MTPSDIDQMPWPVLVQNTVHLLDCHPNTGAILQALVEYRVRENSDQDLVIERFEEQWHVQMAMWHTMIEVIHDDLGTAICRATLKYILQLKGEL